MISVAFGLQAGLVCWQIVRRGRRAGAGLYSWLPLGLRVRRNIERVIREEMTAAGAVIVGKVHTDEFAYSMFGSNAHYGTPDNPRVLLPRARVRLQTGSINEAEKDVSRVLERAPNDVMARYMKASIQLLRGDANAARATFQPIEGALADYAPALLLGGLIKFNTGQYAQAEASINRFLAVAPDHVPALQRSGDLLLQLGQPAAARARLEKALALDPDNGYTARALRTASGY